MQEAAVGPGAAVFVAERHGGLSDVRVGEVLDGPDERQRLLEEEVSSHVSHQFVGHVGVLLDEVLHVVDAEYVRTCNYRYIAWKSVQCKYLKWTDYETFSWTNM